MLMIFIVEVGYTGLWHIRSLVLETPRSLDLDEIQNDIWNAYIIPQIEKAQTTSLGKGVRKHLGKMKDCLRRENKVNEK